MVKNISLKLYPLQRYTFSGLYIGLYIKVFYVFKNIHSKATHFFSSKMFLCTLFCTQVKNIFLSYFKKYRLNLGYFVFTQASLFLLQRMATLHTQKPI